VDNAFRFVQAGSEVSAHEMGELQERITSAKGRLWTRRAAPEAGRRVEEEGDAELHVDLAKALMRAEHGRR
jgi:hypothetical protein